MSSRRVLGGALLSAGRGRALCTLQSRALLSSPSSSRIAAAAPVRMSSFAAFKVPTVSNEPNHHYAKGSAQRAGLSAAIERFRSDLPLEIPIVVGGKEVRVEVSPPAHVT
ncbi:hypothetical protein VTK73DRAFT_5213 [Phialemonium thermophilum]|uniref:Uncharacterized protein n=1 Tax=Phialemonium thermophilum TaxID=223376 RepID=A0ABR3V2Y0_9PEZI